MALKGKLHCLFNLVNEGIVVTNSDGVISEVNVRMMEMCAADNKGRLIGTSISEIIADCDVARAMSDLRKTCKNSSINGKTYTFRRLDGSEYLGTTKVCVVEGTGSKESSYMIAIEDISRQKEMEEQLNRNIERFRSLVNNLRLGVMRSVPGPPVHPVEVNRAMEDITGYSRKELLEMDFNRMYVDVRERKILLDEFFSGAGAVTRELRWKKKDGTEIAVLDRAAVVRNLAGEVEYFDAVIEDITERKRAEREIDMYQKKLRSLASQLTMAEQQERRRIAREVHDRLVQSMAIISMRVGSLIKLSPDLAQSLMSIQEYIKKLIEEARSLTFELGSPLLHEFGLEAALEDFTEQFGKDHNIEIFLYTNRKDFSPSESVSIIIFSAVRELLLNIIKHSRATSAKISIIKGPCDIRVSVEDNGVGFSTIPLSDSLHKFEGFGLFDINERLRNIGGHIEIKSEPGCGTAVTLRAPIEIK